MSQKIKPCPFCGGEALTESDGWMWDHCHWVCCAKCGATSGSIDADNYKVIKSEAQLRALAVKRWNRRATLRLK